MIYFFRRGPDALTCETRLNADGPGYELVVAQGDDRYTEKFETLPAMLAREHELLQAWRAQGWQDISSTRRR